MQNVFTVKKVSESIHGKHILSDKDRDRLLSLGFTESEEGFFIDLQKLDTKYRMRKQADKWRYSAIHKEELEPV